VEDVTITFFRGSEIGCYACHQGPDDETANPNRRPLVNDASASCRDQPVTIPLAASDPDGDPLTLRIVRQPSFGRVGLSGTQATYLPDPGFAGVDSFTFTAADGAIDGNLGTVSVTRQAAWSLYGAGYPGTGGLVPAISLDADPALGADVSLQVQNVAGRDTVMIVLAATEPALLDTNKGGVLLTEPLLLFAAPLPQNGADLGWSIPNDPAFLGLSIYAQALEADTGARWRIAFSRGIRMTLGP
jgi:hypothetical protein